MNIKQLGYIIVKAKGSLSDPIVYIDINDPEKAEDLNIQRTPLGLVVTDSDEKARRVMSLEKENAELKRVLNDVTEIINKT